MKKYYAFFRGESYSPAYMTKQEWEGFLNFESSKSFTGDSIDEYCNTVLNDYRSKLPNDGIEVMTVEEL